MKPRLFTAIVLFISAYSPLFIILAVKDFDFKSSHLKHPFAVYILLAFTILSLFLLFLSVKLLRRGTMPVEVININNRSVDLINYTIPYILSFFGFDLSKPGDVISLSIFLFILLLLTLKTQSVFLNPILALFGYGLYDLEYKFDGKKYKTTTICKYEVNDGDRYYLIKLTRFLYFVTKKVEDDDDGIEE